MQMVAKIVFVVLVFASLAYLCLVAVEDSSSTNLPGKFSLVQGDHSGWKKSPIDFNLGHSVILLEQ